MACGDVRRPEASRRSPGSDGIRFQQAAFPNSNRVCASPSTLHEDLVLHQSESFLEVSRFSEGLSLWYSGAPGAVHGGVVAPHTRLA